MKKVVVMAMTALALVGCAPKNENPFLNYQNWKTPEIAQSSGVFCVSGTAETRKLPGKISEKSF